ncbi:MAG TPA: MFS transporter [Cycloclasticus sp.]|nr:MFS transporter [Cycloclasticus sp.]
MNVGQWIIVAICIGTLALDGYDVLSIAFAAPGITQEWGLSKSILGIVLSIELAGMAVGSILLGSLADSHGRRLTMLAGLSIVTLGMFIAGFAPNIYLLGAARLFTGLGIGCILATATATCSDFCNDKNRVLSVTLVAGGFPLGIYLGAAFLAPLLKQYDWRVTFYLGAFLSFLFIPLVYFYVPETISFLNRKRPAGALEKIQKTMRRLGHTPPEALPLVAEQEVEIVGIKSLFGPNLRYTTLILGFAYFGNVMTYYYFVKWLPTVVTDLGYTASQATEVLGVISLGGILGAIGISLGARFLPIRLLMLTSLMLTAIGVALFPHFTDSMVNMKSMGFFAGIFVMAAISGFFGLFASSFPSSVLGSGAGLVLGVGRGGAVLGPMIPGFLFAAGLAFENIAIMMGSGSFLAGLAVIFLHKKKKA